MKNPSRRQFLKSVAQTTLAAQLSSGMFSNQKSTDSPNIILLLADDQRNDTLGSAGHPIIQTPNIDSLSENGFHFDNAFVTTSICAASRATIFTGLYERTHDYTFGKPDIHTPYILNSYPTQLRNHGYKTAFIGKFGVNIAAEALDSMFDYRDLFPRAKYFFDFPDGSVKHETDHAIDQAIEFINNEQDHPFMVTVSFNSPHANPFDFENHFPWPESTDGMYENIEIPEPLFSFDDMIDILPEFLQTSLNRERFFWRWDTVEKYQRNMKAYFRMITGIDFAIGRLRQRLDELQLADNTILIYMSDNGYYMGNRGFAGKWSHYEESLRVPLVVYDPRANSSLRGTRQKSLALNVDIAPTILHLAGIETPESYQGLSLLPLIYNNQPLWRDDFFCEHLMDHNGIPKWEGVRSERFIYARYFEQSPVYEFLHEFQTDPNQLVNLATDPNYQDLLNSMRSRCDTLAQYYEGQQDTVFTNGFEI